MHDRCHRVVLVARTGHSVVIDAGGSSPTHTHTPTGGTAMMMSNPDMLLTISKSIHAERVARAGRRRLVESRRRESRRLRRQHDR
jgi:hypothetical protein